MSLFKGSSCQRQPTCCLIRKRQETAFSLVYIAESGLLPHSRHQFPTGFKRETTTRCRFDRERRASSSRRMPSWKAQVWLADLSHSRISVAIKFKPRVFSQLTNSPLAAPSKPAPCMVFKIPANQTASQPRALAKDRQLTKHHSAPRRKPAFGLATREFKPSGQVRLFPAWPNHHA